MKRVIIIIFALILTTACAFLQKTEVVAPVEEILNTDIVEPTKALPEIPVYTPTPTEEAEKVFQPYLTDFSEAADDWEVVLSEGTNDLSQEDGQLILTASGISSTVVGSPNSVNDASEIIIEVDVSFANTETEGEGGKVGIICGYTSQDEFYSFEVDKEGVVSISFTNQRQTYLRLSEPDEQNSYHLQAICSSMGLGLMIDGEKILQQAVTDFQPGRIGLFSTGAFGLNNSTSEILELPNTAVFDNFSIVAMQAKDEWVNEPFDPFDYLSVKEVIYTDDFASPSSDWSYSDAPQQMVKLENGKLVIYTDSDKTFPWANLNSITGFTSGVMMETDFTILPGSYKFSKAGFLCDIHGDWTNFYDIHINSLGVDVFKFSNGGWKGYASVVHPNYADDFLEIGKTYHLTGICGGGYLALLLDGVPQLVMPVSEQQIHSIGLTGGIPSPSRVAGEAIIHFDNFKLTRLKPINN